MLIKEGCEKYFQNDIKDESNLRCKKHNKKFVKYDIEIKEHLCPEDDPFSSSIIKLDLDREFKILLKNFIQNLQKSQNNLKYFYELLTAICWTFYEYPTLDSYISLISAIKLILNDNKLFSYTEGKIYETKDREELQKNFILIEIDMENKLDKKIIYSKCCKSSIKFVFISKNKIEADCFCQRKNLNLNQCLELIQKELTDENEYKDMYCKIKDHNNNKYISYCQDCEKNMCPSCSIDLNPLNHTRKDFGQTDIRLKDFVQFGEEFCKLINAIINTYILYPNMKCYESLENAKEFLNKNKNNQNNIEENKNNKEGEKINEFEELSKRKRKPKDYEKIIEILFQAKNIRSLRYFIKLKNLKNLQVLMLKENCIDSIKWLTKVNFLNNLKILDLSSNKLGDYNIKFFKKLSEGKKLINLEELYLHENIFQDLLMLKFLQFPKLKILYLGYNDFQKISDKEYNKEFNDKNKKYNFSNLKQFGLTCVFLNNDINFLEQIALDSLENLYLQCNNLNSLSFLNKLECKNLKQIHLSNNLLKEIDIKAIKKFEKMEKVVVDKNNIEKIINIEELKEFNKLEIKISNNNLVPETKNYLKSVNQNNLKVNL